MNKDLTVLGIETSCDDTSMAILRQVNGETHVLAHICYGQEDSLKHWGGVVPEIAARNHLQKIRPTLEEVLQASDLKMSDIDLISVTTLPGLLGPLLTGLNTAKTLSLLYKKPIMATNHLFAHLEAIHIDQEVSYPYLGLLVSGGHSIYFLVENRDKFTVLGSTIDDAAGEAFDKGGKLLGLGYPAGHIIDRMAKFGDSKRFTFPIGLKSSANSQLSYSGLKTALRVFLEKNNTVLQQIPTQFSTKEEDKQDFYDTCASYQCAIVSALLLKLKYALKMAIEKGFPKNIPIVVGGGVASNSELRSQVIKKYPQAKFVNKKFCTDNGAMIANFGIIHHDQAIRFPECLKMDARGRYLDKKAK